MCTFPCTGIINCTAQE
uniref:Uncharacterized protein n=1 Tax=Arundo donax TaxID=35708 RepID=A0A0A8ZMJ1_ARUDO